MELYYASLNSGSNGNCYYVGTATEGVLVDVGISCREVELRMKALGLSMESVKALFISHEHADHIRGLAVLAARYNLSVYGSSSTLRGCYLKRKGFSVHELQAHEVVRIGSLDVYAFPKLHDAADPQSFVVSAGDTRVGVFTDLGAPCVHLIKQFARCHAAFLESNYDEEMLEKGRYPYYLKKRIRGGLGHLSNRQALELFQQHAAPHLQHLILSHLSKENNCPRLVASLFESCAGTTQVTVASREAPSALFRVKSSGPVLSQLQASPPVVGCQQMRLF
jgi:phosphoribosyl 1,2-cyclic phosphodiesterase